VGEAELGRRIAVVGPSGAGKTTLARRLAQMLDVPHVELDALHWEANWTEAPDALFRERTSVALAGEGWTTDGNYGQVRDIVWGRADTLVWLDFSLPLVLRRLAKRSWRRVRSNEVLWSGNQEQVRNFFKIRPTDNLFLWTIKTHRGRKRTYPKAVAAYPNLRLVRLRTPRDLEAWLAGLGLANTSNPPAPARQ
jgi:adenylate kinase family enzyme